MVARKFYLSKEDLSELLESSSRDDIATQFKCSRSTVDNWCKKYGIASKKTITFDVVKSYFEEHGCELLETEYNNNRHPMKYKCSCGEVSTVKWIHFRRGQRCRECRRRKFIGPNNHKWNHQKTDVERLQDRKYFEYTEWVKSVFSRDNYTCQLCDSRGGNLNAHHLYGYDCYEKERLCLDNGITLCEQCHKMFHKRYGYGGNTREQFVNNFLFSISGIDESVFLDVTEKCAMEVFDLLGCGDPKLIDKVATQSIRSNLNEIEFSGKVVICEGKKDDSYGLYNEHVGKLNIPILDVDIACDPVDGSTRSSKNQSDACSILVVSSKGSLYIPETFYMNKAVTRKDIYFEFNDYILELPPKEIAKTLSRYLKRQPVVSLLKRERNQSYIDEFLENGCNVRLINDCDVFGALSVFQDIDLYYGIGGAPEAVLTAAAVKTFGGEMEASCYKDGVVDDRILRSIDLVSRDSIFVSTGITDGNMLKGVENTAEKRITHSIFSTSQEGRCVRRISTEHYD